MTVIVGGNAYKQARSSSVVENLAVKKRKMTGLGKKTVELKV